MTIRINIGCGQSPTPGWHNYDNSPAIWIGKSRLVAGALTMLGLLDRGNLSYIDYCRRNDIKYADAIKRIPYPDGSVSAIYSSHMLEHLDRAEARRFMQECHRALEAGGILRIAVPDLLPLARAYVAGGSADGFLSACVLELEKPRGLAARLRHVVFSGREHHWMYDGASLSQLMREAGFADTRVLEAGRTTIPDPGELNLHERESESVYVEGRKPLSAH
jgi:predicted SAM-dependent methyltransferase